MTYIWAGTQWLYLAVVLDLYARRVEGWAMSDAPDSEVLQGQIDFLLDRRPLAGVIARTDQFKIDLTLYPDPLSIPPDTAGADLETLENKFLCDPHGTLVGKLQTVRKDGGPQCLHSRDWGEGRRFRIIYPEDLPSRRSDNLSA